MSAAPQELIGEFIRTRFPQIEFTDDQDIFSLGFVNSLFAMELVMFVEKTFGFSVPSSELRLDTFRTVESIAALVERQTAQAVRP